MQHVHNFITCLRIQITRGLIGHEKDRVVHQRHGDQDEPEGNRSGNLFAFELKRLQWYFDVEEEGYFTAENPMADNTDLNAFPWPDPNDPDLLNEAAAIIEADSDQHFITPNFGWALFERAWSLRGLDIFMMDMVMDPGMDGLDTYKAILDIHPGQKAIIASGYSESDQVRQAQALGAGQYVRKPYSLQKIAVAIRRELDRGRETATALC